jgi:hypothetical protein
VRGKANLLILYDDQATHIGTVAEHLESFSRYSRHNIFYMPATGVVPGLDQSGARLDAEPFDAVIIHYSVRLSLNNYISPSVSAGLAEYGGPKLLFIQDEYENTETARRWIEHLGITAVFTTVPLQFVERVYPRQRFPGVDFLPTLTGYVPESDVLDQYALPMHERSIVLGYRGRVLPYQYGDLGQEKVSIGNEMRQRARARGVVADIEVDDAHRIYGDDWYRFLGKCRAMLGSESGASIFDDDGSLRKLAIAHSRMTYEEFRAAFLGGRESEIRMNQISPKIFEAIRLRTALVLFPGEYSGMIRPHEHFIPLNKDYSNANEVFNLLLDVDALVAMTQRAYRDVIDAGLGTYMSFIRGVDHYLEARLTERPRARIAGAVIGLCAAPSAGFREAGEGLSPLLSNLVFTPNHSVDHFVGLLSQFRLFAPFAGWRLRYWLRRTAHKIVTVSMESRGWKKIATTVAIGLWRLVPRRLRGSLKARIL